MDIKDFILIGGGLTIAAVIAHGFWIAWRGRQEPLRIDIQPDLIPDDVDDIERLRGELPNGGARVINGVAEERQQALELEPILLELEPPEGPPPSERPRSRQEPLVAERDPELTVDRVDEPVDTRPVDVTPPHEASGREAPALRTEARVGRRPRVAEVALPQESSPAKEPDAVRTGTASARGSQRGAQRRAAERAREKRAEPAPTDELIILNVLASAGHVYTGDAIFTVLRDQGLKFGDMNIFHRVEPLTKAIDYSVANVVEPGTFDMADMEAFRAPGLCFFMQLPGPEHPGDAFDDMLGVARAVADRLGGEVSDEQRNRLTGQAEAHYRQRIADFARRRMSKRA